MTCSRCTPQTAWIAHAGADGKPIVIRLGAEKIQISARIFAIHHPYGVVQIDVSGETVTASAHLTQHPEVAEMP
jgi:hypothetical protein